MRLKFVAPLMPTLVERPPEGEERNTAARGYAAPIMQSINEQILKARAKEAEAMMGRA